MDSAGLEDSASSFPGNQLTAYLCTLAAAKTGLPYGQPVCVCASHTISNTHALLQLASSVGPHIAVLQISADIIDDWSDETARQLTALAKKHAFLVWEGGRILNSMVDIVGKHGAEVREVKNELVSLIRKKYTRGTVKTASWAGIATAWASGVAEDNQEADILIPTLRAAARETVAGTVRTVRTVITAENSPDPSSPTDHETEDTKHYGQGQQQLSAEHIVDDDSTEPCQRKGSTISLTQTISQHTEESTNVPVEDEQCQRRDSFDQILTNDNLPPPPLLGRGLVLRLPSVTSTSFTTEYRRSCIAAARANPDFVVGFLYSEPWQTFSHRSDILDIEEESMVWGQDEERSNAIDTREQYLAVFSLIPYKHTDLFAGEARANDDNRDINDEPMSPTSTTGPDPFAVRLHKIIEHALKVREASSPGKDDMRSQAEVDNGLRIVHIPVVALP